MPAKRRQPTKTHATAAGIGRALGRTTAKIDSLMKQRAQLTRELRDVIAAAQDMLADLGDTAAIAKHRTRRKVRQLKRRKRKVSKEARARMAAAARRRWARARKAKAAKR